MESNRQYRMVRRLAVDIRQLLDRRQVVPSDLSIAPIGLIGALGTGIQLSALGAALLSHSEPPRDFVQTLLTEFRSDSELMPLVGRELSILLGGSSLDAPLAVASEWAKQMVDTSVEWHRDLPAIVGEITPLVIDGLGIRALTPVPGPLEELGLRVGRIVETGLCLYGGSLEGGLERGEPAHFVLAALLEAAVDTGTLYLQQHGLLEMSQVGIAATLTPYLYARSPGELFVGSLLPTWQPSRPLIGPAAAAELYGNLWSIEHQHALDAAVQGLVAYAAELQERVIPPLTRY